MVGGRHKRVDLVEVIISRQAKSKELKLMIDAVLIVGLSLQKSTTCG